MPHCHRGRITSQKQKDITGAAGLEKSALLPVTELEVRKAADTLGEDKAPGPDDLPAEVYKNLRALHGPLAALFTLILETGRIPGDMLQLLVVPLEKPEKPRSSCAAKRPISLICAVAKLLEVAVLHRILPAIEGQLNPVQFAYRRARGTEMLLAELADFMTEHIAGGWYVYVSSLDLSGAFDTEPHLQLILALEGMGVDRRILQYVECWLRSRKFRVRPRTPMGSFKSKTHSIGRGLPQEGVLSPLLWLVFFNGLPARLAAFRASPPTVFQGYPLRTSFMRMTSRRHLYARMHVRSQ